MKRVGALIILALAGCATTARLAPVTPDDVQARVDAIFAEAEDTGRWGVEESEAMCDLLDRLDDEQSAEALHEIRRGAAHGEWRVVAPVPLTRMASARSIDGLAR